MARISVWAFARENNRSGLPVAPPIGETWVTTADIFIARVLTPVILTISPHDTFWKTYYGRNLTNPEIKLLRIVRLHAPPKHQQTSSRLRGKDMFHRFAYIALLLLFWLGFGFSRWPYFKRNQVK